MAVPVGVVAALSGLTGVVLSLFVEQHNARRWRNQEERRKTGADYLVALDALRRGLHDKRGDKDLQILAREHADLAQRMELYFDRATSDCVADANEKVAAMHRTFLA